jgi:hypothetical protein
MVRRDEEKEMKLLERSKNNKVYYFKTFSFTFNQGCGDDHDDDDYWSGWNDGVAGQTTFL